MQPPPPRYSFSDLVDLQSVKSMLEDFHGATGFVVGIVDPAGVILVQVGYRDICTQFHRRHLETQQRCIASDTRIASELEAGLYKCYTCANGLIDAASPLVIDGEHLATIYTGQFLFQPPDEAFFLKQAQQFGFDEQAYLAALRDVPVVSRTRYEAAMSFLTKLARFLGELGLREKHQREIEAALRQAQKMEAVGRLAGGVAHDFNNMLQAVLAYAEMLGELVPHLPEATEYVKGIQHAGERAASLVKQLLAFGRKNEGSRTLLDLATVTSDFVPMLRRLLGEHVELRLACDAQVPAVLASAVQVEQVLMNLCVNARDAMPRGGTITVQVRETLVDEFLASQHAGAQPGTYVVLQVADTGTGIAPEHMDHIFEPFFSTKEVGAGTGLGLATTYAVVGQHHGFVTVDSTLARGTTFRVYLPASVVMPPAGEGVVQQPAAPRGHGQVLLLAEDEEAVRTTTRHLLEEAGYELIMARDGLEAIQEYCRHGSRVELLILDVVMPGKNGREVLAHARGINPDVPVLFCSGYTRDILQKDYLVHLPAGQLLHKPFSRFELLSAVAELLDRASMKTALLPTHNVLPQASLR